MGQHHSIAILMRIITMKSVNFSIEFEAQKLFDLVLRYELS